MDSALQAAFSGTVANAGLLLVFLGLVYSVHSSYAANPNVPGVVLKKYKRAIWAIVGLLAGHVGLALVGLAALVGLIPAWISVLGFAALLIALLAVAVWVTCLIL